MLFAFLRFVLTQLFRAIKACMRLALQCFVFGLVLLVVCSTLFGLLHRKKEKALESGTILVLDLSESIVEVSKGFQEFQPQATRLMDAVQGLKAAAKDERIAGLLIRADSPLASSMSDVLKYELRESIAAFKAHKPVIAYLRDSHRQDYTLASIAHTVYMHPLGHLSILGTGCEVIFWGDAFKKYGLRAHVFKCGRYKSATEPFTENKMSPESREQLSSFLQELWQYSADTLVAVRPISRQALEAVSQTEGILSADRALELKLIDAICHENELGAYFENAKLIDSKQDYAKLSLSAYAQRLKEEPASDSTVALLYAEGVISNQKTRNWDTLSIRTLIKHLRTLRARDDVKAIVLRINSPGGEASASEDLRHELELTKAIKPVIISMGPYAASGGYWAALGGSSIFAHPCTLTGSIGAFAMLVDWEGLGLQHGIKADRVATSPLASIYSASSSKSEVEKRILQNLTDKTYERFLSEVAQSRHMEYTAVQAAAQGRIWSGRQALELGLVDQLGTLTDALNYAAQGLEDWQLEEYPKDKTYLELVSDIWKGEGYALGYCLRCLPQSIQRFIYTYCYNQPCKVFSLMDYQLDTTF